MKREYIINCDICDDTMWICESCGTRWELKEGGTCCSAGKSCTCNPNGMCDWKEIICSTDDNKTVMF